jgi:hypothetical protein
MDFKKIIYLGVFLDEKSKMALLEQFPPMHPNIFGAHVTLAFRPTEEEIKRFEPAIGKTATIDVNGLKYNTKGQAIEVMVLDDLLHLDQNPFRKPGEQPLHITISTAAGVPPKYSKELVQDDTVAWRPVSMKLTGVFNTFPTWEAELVPCEDCKADHADPITAAAERIAIGAKPKGLCCEWSRRQLEKKK